MLLASRIARTRSDYGLQIGLDAGHDERLPSGLEVPRSELVANGESKVCGGMLDPYSIVIFKCTLAWWFLIQNSSSLTNPPLSSVLR